MTPSVPGPAHNAVRANVPLAPLTTYKVGGRAKWFAEPQDLEELRSILEVTLPHTPVVVLGRGSNVVVSDEGIDGLVLRLGQGFSSLELGTDGVLVAGGGLPLPRLARAAAEAGRAGLGFYVGIPGSVGGAVRMNAGGHGSDTAAVLVSAVVVDTTTGELTIRPSETLDLGYRTTNLATTDIVVQASFRTDEGDPDALMAELREITRWRKEHQPGGTLNAGSVFKNPPDRSAGEIIDSLGLKGFAVGPVSVSGIHANFMIAEPDANATAIWTFVHNIQRMVHERTGIRLEPEIKFLGAFPDNDV